MKYKMKIEPITFIHIGSGNEIDFFNYLITDDKTFYRIDCANFYDKLKSENDKKKFAEIISDLSNTSPENKEEYSKLRKNYLDIINKAIEFFKRKPEKKKGIILYEGKVGDDVYNDYKMHIDDVNNQFIINEAIHSASNYGLYIPGSSLKGAIRTALLSYIINKLNLEENEFNIDRREAKKFIGRAYEGEILKFYKGIQKDPFRALRIFDSDTFKIDSSIILENKNFNIENTKDKRKLGFKSFNEYISHEVGYSTFEIDINDTLLHENFEGISQRSKAKGEKSIKFKDLFNIDKIKEACNEFYLTRLEEDYEKYFSKIEKTGIKILDKKEIEEKIDKNKNEFLIRIGRFSQFESVTIDKLRDKLDLHSRMLVNHNYLYYPVGWAKISW